MAKSKAEIAAYMREWYATNKERIRPRKNELHRAWRANNKEKPRNRVRAWEQNNPERVREIQRAWQIRNPDSCKNGHLKRRYGITLDEWNTLFTKQGNKCAICGDTHHHGKNWHTDHCHVTNKVRGILCNPCNTFIGQIEKSEERDIAARTYIEKHKEQRDGV